MAGAGVEAELQLTNTTVNERRGTLRLLLVMLAWVGAGFIAAFAVAAIMGFASILLYPLLHRPIAPPGQLAFVLAAATTFQASLLLAALWQGRRAGGGDLWAGLGVRPIHRGGRIALCCVAMIIWLMAFVLMVDAWPALRAFVKAVTPDLLAGLGEGGPFVVAVRLLLVAVLAPISEELFFRGWLWEAARRRGHAVGATAALTAIPWLLLHGIDSPGRVVFLIPAAVVFSLARQQGGGVLASLLVHATNNTAAVTLQALALLFGHKP